MNMRTIVFVSLALAALTAAAVFMAHKLYWRPVAPEIIVEFRGAEDGERPKELLLLYGEAGSDPFRSGKVAPDQRVSGCYSKGTLCTAPPARHELRIAGTRSQSVQIRVMNGRGNPILGGVAWTGPSYPRRIRLVCDLGISEPRKACAMLDILV